MVDKYVKYGEIVIVVEGDGTGMIRFKTEPSSIKSKKDLIELLDKEINSMLVIMCDGDSPTDTCH